MWNILLTGLNKKNEAFRFTFIYSFSKAIHFYVDARTFCECVCVCVMLFAFVMCTYTHEGLRLLCRHHSVFTLFFETGSLMEP